MKTLTVSCSTSASVSAVYQTVTPYRVVRIVSKALRADGSITGYNVEVFDTAKLRWSAPTYVPVSALDRAVKLSGEPAPVFRKGDLVFRGDCVSPAKVMSYFYDFDLHDYVYAIKHTDSRLKGLDGKAVTADELHREAK